MRRSEDRHDCWMKRYSSVYCAIYYHCVIFLQVLNGTTTIKTYQDTSAVVHRRSYNMPFYGDIFGTLVYANPRNACSPVSEATSTNLIAFVPNYDDCIGQNVSLTIYCVFASSTFRVHV